MSTSLLVLLWACGALIALACIALTEGKLIGMSLFVALVWPVSLPLGLLERHQERVIWRKKP